MLMMKKSRRTIRSEKIFEIELTDGAQLVPEAIESTCDKAPSLCNQAEKFI